MKFGEIQKPEIIAERQIQQSTEIESEIVFPTIFETPEVNSPKKPALNFKFNKLYNHEKITPTCFRAQGSHPYLYNLTDTCHDSLSDLLKICKKLDLLFYGSTEQTLRVHAIYYKQGDKFVNIGCRIKNCSFRVNHTYDKDSKGRP